MPRYEFKVVPAPEQGKKGRGVKGPKGRFANALESLMNDLGAEGWDYVRADTLPFEERTGLTGKTTTFQNLLVFRRVLDEPEPAGRVGNELPPVAGLLEAPSATPTPQLTRGQEPTDSATANAVAALSAYRQSRKQDLAAE